MSETINGESHAIRREQVNNLLNLTTNSIAMGSKVEGLDLAKKQAFSVEDVQSYFSTTAINEATIREFLLKHGFSKEQMSGILPNIVLMSDKEKIVSAIEQKGYSDALSLAKTIAEHIRENMMYSAHVGLDSMIALIPGIEQLLSPPGQGPMGSLLSVAKYINRSPLESSQIGDMTRLIANQEKPEAIVSLEKWTKLLQILERSGIDIGKLKTTDIQHLAISDAKKMVFSVLTEHMRNKKSYGFSEVQLTGIRNELRQVETNLRKNGEISPAFTRLKVAFQGDPDAVKNQLIDNLQDEKFRQYFHAFMSETRADYNKTNEASELLYTLKVGVCRHYSMIAKQIFNEIAKKHNIDAEMLYVSNTKANHAYNLLVYTGPDNQVHRQYVDITLFITEGDSKLLRKLSDPSNREEIIAQNIPLPIVNPEDTINDTKIHNA